MPSDSITSSWWLLVKVFKIVFFIDRSESRISRGQYWIGTGMLALFQIYFRLLMLVLWDSFIISAVSIILSAWLGILWLFLMIKRLHDLNMSTSWKSPVVLYSISLLGLIVLFTLLLFFWWELDLLFPWSKWDSHFFQNIVNGTTWMMWIVLLIVLIIGLRLSLASSVNENNKFWPDPLRNITVTNHSYWLIVVVLFLLSIFIDTFAQLNLDIIFRVWLYIMLLFLGIASPH